MKASWDIPWGIPTLGFLKKLKGQESDMLGTTAYGKAAVNYIYIYIYIYRQLNISSLFRDLDCFCHVEAVSMPI